MHGLLNLNKPAGVTSRDVVNQVQRLARRAKIGHAGTLDPLATGVLVVCIGHATRLIEYVQQLPKSYEATFLLGRRSDTDDVDGSVTEIAGAREPTRRELEAALPAFTGAISQRPPQVSAVKVKGQRAYDLARRGQQVALAERLVSVHSLRVARYEYPELELAIECGSGTYVRSIGRDLAELLGTAAVMSQLARTAIGLFRIDAAVDPRLLETDSLGADLLPMETAVQALPAVYLTEEEAVRVRRGQSITRPQHAHQAAVAAFDLHSQLVAILVPRDADILRPEKVIHHESSVPQTVRQENRSSPNPID